MAEWTPFQTHCYSGNLVVPGIEPGTSESAARNCDQQTTEAVDERYNLQLLDFLREAVAVVELVETRE
jgi:hypothetical protein